MNTFHLADWLSTCDQKDLDTIVLIYKFQITPENILAWLGTPHAELDGKTPFMLISTGDGQIVHDMLMAAYHGIPT